MVTSCPPNVRKQECVRTTDRLLATDAPEPPAAIAGFQWTNASQDFGRPALRLVTCTESYELSLELLARQPAPLSEDASDFRNILNV